MKRCLLLVLAVFTIHATTASAHYLWLRIDPDISKHGRANLYFEHAPAPGDGKYTPPIFKRGKAWIRTVQQLKPSALKLTTVKKPGKLWLGADLGVDAPRAVDSYVKWGVYAYGKTQVLLHYTARTLDVNTPEQFNKLGRAKHLDLDVSAKVDGNVIHLQVFWKGKPASGRPIFLQGPVKATLKTDENGKAQFEATKRGFYYMRTHVDEKDNPGVFEGKRYDMKRFHSALSFDWPLSAEAK